jgi:CheY-like chemotaxis protein
MSFKILVVEDNYDSRELLHYLLTSKGFNVATAGDGTEGFYMTRVVKPDLVITDLTMPFMDGVELTLNIRSEPELSGTPIVVYTSYGIEDARPAMKAGANFIFYKPVDFERMIEYINDLSKEPGKSNYLPTA